MFEHAIGFDCAGYTQQAYLRATGRTRDQLGWDTLDNEGLFNLSGHAFVPIKKVQDLRPADIIVFDSTDPPVNGRPAVGHRTIVFDQRPATDSDKSALAAANNAKDFSAAGDLRVVEMDSSYGAWRDFHLGGVQRQMWFFNGTKWAHLMRADQEVPPPRGREIAAWVKRNDAGSGLPWLDIQDGLYGPDDKVTGFYRHRSD